MVADADTGQQGIADHVDLDHVGGAGDADGNTGGDDDEVAVLHKARALGLRNRHTDELIRGGRVVHQQRGNAAVDIELTAGRIVQHAGNDLGVGAETAQQAGGLTALGSRDDGGSADVCSGGAGGMADGSADVQAAVVRTGVVDQTVKAGVCLGGLGNRSHGLQRLNGVLARGGLAGEHDRAGAVVDGVGNIGDLGTGRAGVDDHGIQHLGGGNANLTGAHGAVDQVLLDGRDLGKVDLNAHIAAGNHDAVCHGQDLVNVVDALLVLDLRDDADLGVVLVQDVADIHNVLRVAGKAGGDQVKALLDTKQNIARVALAHIRHGQMHAGNVDALLGLDDAVIADRTDNVGVADLDPATGLDVVGQLLVSDGADFVRALYAAGGQGELLAGGQLLHTVLELTQTNLGTLGVQHTGNGQIQLLGKGTHLVKAALMLLIVAVGKVETGNIHAIFHQLTQDPRLIGRRTHRADNFRFAHKTYPP